MLCGPSISDGMTPTGTTRSTDNPVPLGLSQVAMSPDSLTTPTRYPASAVCASAGTASRIPRRANAEGSLIMAVKIPV